MSDVTIGIGAKLDNTVNGAVGEMRETLGGIVSEYAAPLAAVARGETLFGAGITFLKDRITELVLGPLATLFLSLGGIDLTMRALGYSTQKTAEGLQNVQLYENLEAQFKPLLGSMQEAKARMLELQKIADVSPYQLTDVAGASKELEVLTGGKLATGDGLKHVIDAAIVSGGNLQDVAMQIGRMYDDIANGRPMGLAARRLEELGLLSGKTRNELEKLLKEGQSGSAVWAVFEKDLDKTAGATEQAAKTITGLTTTLADATAAASRGFGEGFADTEKDSIKASTAAFRAFIPVAEEAGKVANSLGMADWPHMTFPVFDVPIKNFIAWVLQATTVWKVFLNAFAAGAVGVGTTVLGTAIVSVGAFIKKINPAKASLLEWAAANDTLGQSLSKTIAVIGKMTPAELATKFATVTAAVGKLTVAEIGAKAATLENAAASAILGQASALESSWHQAALNVLGRKTVAELAALSVMMDETEAAKFNIEILKLETAAREAGMGSIREMTVAEVESKLGLIDETEATEIHTQVTAVDTAARETLIGSIKGMTLAEIGAKSATLGESGAQEVLAAATKLGAIAADSNIVSTGGMVAKQVAARGVIIGNTAAVWLYNIALTKLKETGAFLGRTVFSPGTLAVAGLTAIYLYWEHIQDYINGLKELGAASVDRVNKLNAERDAISSVDDKNKALADGYAKLKEAQDALNAAAGDDDKTAFAQKAVAALKNQVTQIEAIDDASLKPGDARAQLMTEAANLHAKALEKQRTATEQLLFLEQQRHDLQQKQADLQTKADAAAKTAEDISSSERGRLDAVAQLKAKTDPIQAAIDASVERENDDAREVRSHKRDQPGIEAEQKIQSDLRAQIATVTQAANMGQYDATMEGLKQQLADSQSRLAALQTIQGRRAVGLGAAKAIEETRQADIQAQIDALMAKRASASTDYEATQTNLQAGSNALEVNQDVIEEAKKKAMEEAKALALKVQEVGLERDILQLRSQGTQRTIDEARLRQNVLALQMRSNEAERGALQAPMENYASEQSRLKIDHQEQMNKYLEEEAKIRQAVASEQDRQLERQAQALARAQEMTEKLPKAAAAPLLAEEERRMRELADQMDARAEKARTVGDESGADAWSDKAQDERDRADVIGLKLGKQDDATPVVDSLQRLGLGGRIGAQVHAASELPSLHGTVKEIRDILKARGSGQTGVTDQPYNPGIRVV